MARRGLDRHPAQIGEFRDAGLAAEATDAAAKALPLASSACAAFTNKSRRSPGSITA